MKKKTLTWIIVLVVILIGAIMVVKHAKKRVADAPAATNYSMVVKTIKPEIRQDTLTLPYLAIVKNDEDVMLSSKIAARVVSIIPSGTTISKGQIIARLDNTSIESEIHSVNAQLLAANTSLKNLQATHQRTLELIAVKGASIEQSETEESKIADTQSMIESIKQKLNDLNNNLSYATIKAPTSGIISQTMANVGDMSMPGQPLAIISAKRGAYLEIRVPSDLKVYGVLMNGKSYEAVSLNSTFNGLAEYKVSVNNLALKTNDRIEIDVEVFNGKAIMLPFDAVLNRNGKSYVFEKDGDHAVAKEINIIQTGQNGIVVNNPELAGKEIVVEKPDILLRLLSGVSLKTREE